MIVEAPRVIWAGYTFDEQRVMGFLHNAFGVVTHITREEFDRVWKRPDGAAWDFCPMCLTRFTHEGWPLCGFCGFRDRGRNADYG